MKVSKDDRQLITEILEGNTPSFGILIDRHQDYAFNIAIRLTGNQRELSEEIVQDAFFKAYNNLCHYKNESKFTTWLYRIVYTTAIDALRKTNKIIIVEDFNTQYAHLHAESDWNEFRVDAKLVTTEISNAIKLLDEIDGLIISLYYLQEQSIPEIAEVLGVERNTIKVRLFRARKKIKDILIKKINILS